MDNRSKHTRFTLPATERLKLRKSIETLFRNGKAFSVFPIRIIYQLPKESNTRKSAVQAGFSVSKKKFPNAVHRNRIKRLLREAWRLQKHELNQKQPVDVFLIFTDRELPTFDKIFQAVATAILKINKKLEDESAR